MDNTLPETTPRDDSGPSVPAGMSGSSIPLKHQGSSTCPYCHAPVSATENFCPQCGKKLKEEPLSTTAGKQAVIYLVSFFLAPFGLGYAYKYLKSPDPAARRIGIIVIVITVIAIAIMIWATKAFTEWETHLLGTF
jgi:hypothetical protein